MQSRTQKVIFWVVIVCIFVAITYFDLWRFFQWPDAGLWAL